MLKANCVCFLVLQPILIKAIMYAKWKDKVRKKDLPRWCRNQSWTYNKTKCPSNNIKSVAYI